MDKEKKFTLIDMNKEEHQTFNKELQELIDKHSVHLIPRPFIDGEGRIDAKIMALKKVPLSENEDGSLTPEEIEPSITEK